MHAPFTRYRRSSFGCGKRFGKVRKPHRTRWTQFHDLMEVGVFGKRTERVSERRSVEKGRRSESRGALNLVDADAGLAQPFDGLLGLFEFNGHVARIETHPDVATNVVHRQRQVGTPGRRTD